MRIFITGATGFIGSKLALQIANDGNIVHALYRSKAKIKELNHENIKWFEGDLLNKVSLEVAMNGCEQVYHVAAHAVAWEKSTGDFNKYNVLGTLTILQLAKKLDIKKIVVTSTAGILGPSLKGLVNENSISPLPHFTGYEKSKSESEIAIIEFVKTGMDIVIVNPTRVFGSGVLNESNSVTIMIKNYIKGKWHFIPGNGKSIGNYAYVNDVVNGHILAMKKGIAGERYILGGENLSYNKFFEELQKVSQKNYWLVKLPLVIMLFFAHILIVLNKIFKITPIITPAHVRKFNYNWEISSEKAVKDLGYSITPFRRALTETVSWIEK